MPPDLEKASSRDFSAHPPHSKDKAQKQAEVDSAGSIAGMHSLRHSSSHSGSVEEPRFLFGDDMVPTRRTMTNSSVVSDADYASEMDSEIIRVLSRSAKKSYTDPLPLMGEDKDYPPPLPHREAYKVEYTGPQDPFSPLNWPIRHKILQGASLSLSTMSVAFGSSVFGPAVPNVMKEFHIGQVPALLGVSLYVLGFAAGPIIWGPLSEVYGRSIPLLIGTFGFVLFAFACATAKDVQTIMLSRFFIGVLGASTIALVPACFADMFTTKTRGYAMIGYMCVTMGGPLLGPVVGGFISTSYLGWRWTSYITGIFGALGLVLQIFLVKESYRPKLLVDKARELRARTGNWGIYAEFETMELDLMEIARKSILRPLHMLCVEPVLLSLGIYVGFIYGILYLCIEAVPHVYLKGYHFKRAMSNVPYVSLFVGVQIAAVVTAVFFERRFHRQLDESGRLVLPEARLPPMIVGAIIFPIGIFWFFWTGAYPEHVHWIVPVIGSAFIGAGLALIFLPAQNFIVDTYLPFAASAVAANVFLRSAMATAFPLFANAMFDTMGTQWAGTLLGCVSCALLPCPILFKFYGPWLRRRSRFAYKEDLS